MHHKLKALFDELDAPEHCCRRRTHAAMKPMGAFSAAMQRQMTKYREFLMDAETEDDLPDAFRGKLEFLHQSLGAGDRAAGDVVRITREATSIMAQLERAFGEAKADLEKAAAARDAAGLLVGDGTLPAIASSGVES